MMPVYLFLQEYNTLPWQACVSRWSSWPSWPCPCLPGASRRSLQWFRQCHCHRCLAVGGEDDAHSANVNSSPTASAHAICRALKACVSWDWPLLASFAGSKDSKGNGGNDDGDGCGGSQEFNRVPDWDGPPPLPPLVAA